MKKLRECRGWKIILGIMAGMLLLLILLIVLFYIGNNISESKYEGYRKEAADAGYSREYQSCRPAGDIVIDGATYRCFDCNDEAIAKMMLIDKSASYKGSDRTGTLRIYGRRAGQNDTGTIVEAYAAYPEPVFWNEAGWMLVIALGALPLAEAFAAFILAGYFIVYIIRYIIYRNKAAA